MQVTLLTDDQIRKLDRASIEILETIGVHLPQEEMLGRFQEAGAEVDLDEQLVKIPEAVVRRCLDTAGKSFTIYGRDRSKMAEFGVGRRNYNSIAGEAHWVDDNFNRRFATLEDVRTASRLADALPWINIVGAMSDPHELPSDRQAAQRRQEASGRIGLSDDLHLG